MPARLLRLWAGDATGYCSDMEADLDLLGGLARYCDYDAATLDVLVPRQWPNAAQVGRAERRRHDDLR